MFTSFLAVTNVPNSQPRSHCFDVLWHINTHVADIDKIIEEAPGRNRNQDGGFGVAGGLVFLRVCPSVYETRPLAIYFNCKMILESQMLITRNTLMTPPHPKQSTGTV